MTFEPNEDGKTAPDKKPLMRLSSADRPKENPQRNFFFVVTNMDTGKAIDANNPFMFAKVTSTAVSVTVSRSHHPHVFLCPAAPEQGVNSVEATADLYMNTYYHGSFPKDKVPTKPDATATITLKTDKDGNISWEKRDRSPQHH